MGPFDLHGHDLDPRAREVLREIVMQHIASGEAISSRTLAKCGRFDLSPASLRNVMADLEDLGYLQQPHTSAGRVPTDVAYRLYVDSLMRVAPIASSDRDMLAERLAAGGGSTIEAILRRAAQSLSVLTQELGMCCGGHMEIFLEPAHAPPRLNLFGAGHVALPTARLALSVGFDVNVIDEREELLTGERFPGCTLHLVDAQAYFKRREFHAGNDWVLIATHDHQLDEDVLALAVSRPHAYIGLMGSRRKVLRLVERVQARHTEGTATSFERVYAPVGLELGALTPEEIAVSIVAEWIALRRGKQLGHLSVLQSLASTGAARATERT
jgi:xanthine/CO dehydrogenase XdhC/CoxF family maturation factor